LTTLDVFGEPLVLRTDRLVLRQITESDGEGLFCVFSDDQVTEHYAWDTFTSVGQGHELAARTAEQFRRQEALRWGLVLHHGAFRDVWMFGVTRADR
jgi:RimJ/RimL family protein N-acetyltransferase